MPRRKVALPEGVKPRKPNPHNPIGRPGEYHDGYVELGFNFALLGLNSKEMAVAFGVDESTLFDWKQDHPEFAKSIYEGGEPANAIVAASLYKRAKGYEYVSERVLVVDGDIVHEPVVEHVPPDVRAQQHWLRNKKVNWQDKLQITGPDGGPIQQAISVTVIDPIEAAKTYQKLMESNE